MSGQVLIHLEKIAKIYGQKIIFKDLGLKLGQGELVLLLGDNGAGKSTLLRIMAGLSRPTAGCIKKHDNATIAYLGHATFLYPRLTALENLTFWANASHAKNSRENILQALEKVRLLQYAHEPARVFSRGMAQRLAFARILLQDAQVMLLDEPFSGLDSASRQMMRQELDTMRDQGKAIVLVSHDPQIDGPLADRLLLIKKNGLIPLQDLGAERGEAAC